MNDLQIFVELPLITKAIRYAVEISAVNLTNNNFFDQIKTWNKKNNIKKRHLINVIKFAPTFCAVF